MCNQACVDFGKRYLREEDVRGKAVIEVGALDVNGSLRQSIESLHPSQYVGVDIQPGKGVDRVCRAEDLVRSFGREKFDLLIATELLEHVANWEGAVSNFKNLLKAGGIIVITTRSKGFGYHGFPFDFWRYEISDMERIFSDFSIEAAEKDPSMPGVFMRARKPAGFVEYRPLDLRLYSVELSRRSTINESKLFFPVFLVLRFFANELPEWVKTKGWYKRFKTWKKGL